MTQMSNKVVLITGAAKRIGAQIAKTFHKNNYRVVVHYRNSDVEAENLVRQLNSDRKNSAVTIKANLDHYEEVKKLAKQATEAFGRIDVLVNNASTFYPTPFNSASHEDWDKLFNSNLKAPFFLSQILTPALDDSQGNIINIVDIHAERPLKTYSIYCMAKSGLVSLTKSLSSELAPKIRVNGIAPGPILWHDNPISEAEKASVLNEVSLQKIGSPEDIANAALYLANASYVTGHILAVDGGRSVKASESA